MTLDQEFRERGYLVLRGVIDRSKREPLRSAVLSRIAELRKAGRVTKYPDWPNADFPQGDVFAFPLESVDFIFFSRPVLDALHDILGDDLVYFGDSSVQVGAAARGFHKDNVDRLDGSQPDWDGEYGIVRMGFYFQDHTKHSGGLKVRVASHNSADNTTGPMKDLDTEFGDVVIWNMRLTHSGNNRRLRLAPGLPLPTRLEQRLPESLFLPEEELRIASFCAVAKLGPHLERYLQELQRREPEYRDHFENGSPDSIPFLRSRGIQFRSPHPRYSSAFLALGLIPPLPSGAIHRSGVRR